MRHVREEARLRAVELRELHVLPRELLLALAQRGRALGDHELELRRAAPDALTPQQGAAGRGKEQQQCAAEPERPRLPRLKRQRQRQLSAQRSPFRVRRRRLHAECVTSRRNARVERSAAVAGVDPVPIVWVESIAEAKVLRLEQRQRRILDREIALIDAEAHRLRPMESRSSRRRRCAR